MNKVTTHEEAVARVKASLQKKREQVAMIEAYLKEEHLKKTGKPLKYIFSL